MSKLADLLAIYEDEGLSIIPIHGVVDGRCTCGQEPCPKGAGKHPATEGGEWSTYQKRRATGEEVARWFVVPNRNVGIICGQVSGGLVVVDCDDMDTWAALCYAYPDAARTARVVTGKGVHCYFTCDTPVKTTKFSLNGLTHHVKAEGSYVVAPPSMHASGRQYEWAGFELKPMVLDLERFRHAIASLGAKPVEEQRTEHQQGWVGDLLRQGARAGSRDESTVRLAGYLAPRLSYDETLAVLELWAPRCDQPWGERDVRAKLDSVVRYLK